MWPPSGIALAAILLWGYRIWPGITLGAFLVNFTAQGSAVSALGIATGNTCEALLGAALVTRLANGANAFDRTQNILRFTLLAGFLSTALAASIGTLTLHLGGFAGWSELGWVWLTWWLGDAVGVLTIAPPLVMWLSQPVWPVRSRQILEAAALLAFVVLVSTLLFLNNVPSGLEYFALVPLLWAALRVGRRGAVSGAFVVSSIALWGTLRGYGPFAAPTPYESLLLLQLFIATITMTALIVASVVSEQRRLEQRLTIKDSVSRILSESVESAAAAQKVIQVICETAGWELGEFWIVNTGANQLICAECWCIPSIDVKQFVTCTRASRFAPAIGLPGRVWSSGTSVWINDITKDGNFPRAPEALDAGLHAAFAFPIKLNREILGVLEFFSQEVREPDDEFQQMVAAIGVQFGQWIERRRDQTALRDSEGRLQLALSAAHMGAWEWNIPTGTMIWSPTVEAIHSVEPGTFGGTFDDFKRYIHSDDLAVVLARLQKTIETGGDYNVTYRIARDDGQLRWVEAFGRLTFGAEGRPEKLAGMCKDITEARRQDQTLRQRTHFLEVLNRVGTDLAAQFEISKIVQIIVDAGREISGAQLGAFFYNDRAKSGESYPLYSFGYDPSESSDKFPLRHNPELIGATFSGQRVLRIGDLLSDRRYRKNNPGQDMAAGQSLIRSYLAVPISARSGDIVGGLFFGHSDADVFSAEAETIIAAIAAQGSVAFDNANLYKTIQRRVEEFERLIETAPVGIGVATDAECRNIWGNPEFMRMLGTAPVENIARAGISREDGSFKLLRDGREVPVRELPMHRAAREGAEVLDEELEIARSDGTIVHELCRATPLRDEQGRVRGCIGIFLNITDRKQADAALQQARDELVKANEGLEARIEQRTAELKFANAALSAQREEERRLEQQLRQAQKMESIGTLASGIAHDFNNILNIIKGYSSLLQSSDEPNPQSAEAIQVIDEMVERGAATVRQLLALAKQSELRLEKVDLNDALHKLQTLLTGTFPKNIEITVAADSQRLQVMVDPNQLHQVLLNISLNARDAMPDGGTLGFATEIISGTELRKIFQQAANKTYGCIIVADTGSGIESAVKHRVFEPFFTTKGQGQGSGLGLAVAYGIVANHDGFIDVMSEPGQGATFRIYLPCADDSAGVVAPDSITPPVDLRNPVTAGQCVLFVDDEKRQLAVMRRFLEAAGFRVLVATDGVEAVEQFAKHKDEITAVVLDVGLPKMSGWEAFQKMKTLDPTLRPILASGHISPEIESAMLKGELTAVLMKPYQLKEILEAVCAVARIGQ